MSIKIIRDIENMKFSRILKIRYISKIFWYLRLLNTFSEVFLYFY